MILGMMRIKNESRWIGRVAASLQKACDEVIVFDDHSDDGTPEICEALGITVIRSTFDGLDEVLDKNALLAAAVERKPRWIVHVDGDEEIAPGSHEVIRQIAHDRAFPDAYRFKYWHLWDAPNQVRTDRWYSQFTRPSMFRVQPGQKFVGTGNGGNFHCGNVPGAWQEAQCDVRLLHYGYMHREDRLRKYEWYNAQKPVPEVEDGYRHFVVGDVFPAESVFRWAGPLKLEALNVSV